MAEELPAEYDLIVLGTGLTESIVAAAASRIGKTVLHLDTKEYYGSTWASFNFETLRKLQSHDSSTSIVNQEFDQATQTLGLLNSKGIENFEESWFDFTPNTDVNGWNQEKIQELSRKFSIDLSPRLLFCRGQLVELLISSNISRYAEFRAVDRVATVKDSSIKTVPCSRADVFTNKDVNVVEKRLLMKFLNACMSHEQDQDEFKGYEDKTLEEYLKHKKLTPNLIHYILYAIGMGDKNTKCLEGVKNISNFLSSLGRFGNTPFLFPMYGAGEIPQCFCRLCAVFGGIYCLNSPTSCLHFKKDDAGHTIFEGVKYEERKLTSKNVVIGHGVVSDKILINNIDDQKSTKCGGLSRGIFITSSPIGGHRQNSGGGGVMFIKLPPAEGKNHTGAFVIQLSHHSGTCPKGLHLIHVICESITNSKEDLEPYVQQIMKNTACDIKTPSEEDMSFTDEQPLDEETIPTILWSCYFNIPRCTACSNTHKTVPSNVKLACGPFFELDFDKSINQAREIFQDLYPDEEFLPRAPDPDEILCEGEDATAPKIEMDPFLMETTETLPENVAIEQAKEAKQVDEPVPETAKEAKEENGSNVIQKEPEDTNVT